MLSDRGVWNQLFLPVAMLSDIRLYPSDVGSTNFKDRPRHESAGTSL
jgi:hypothetical protein